ncbi:MAG: NUDIX hydrolase [Polyangiaceae bacterium]
MTHWKVLDERTLLERKWLTITEQHVELPRDVKMEFHLVSSPDWTSVLALTAERQVVIVEQYRHALGGVSRELPAGVIDPGESPLQAAQRELKEETGYSATDWRVLQVVRTEPVRHTNSAHFFFAADARRTQEPTPMEDETIQVRLLDVGELLRWVDDGRIVHGVHVGAILLAARRGWI